MQLEAPIAAVTVYRDNARVVRVGRADVSPGSLELTVTGLSAGLVEESLRVQGRGTAQARLVGVDLHKVYYVEPAEAAIQSLTEALRDLQRQHAALAAQLEAEQKGKEFLLTLLQATGESLAKGIAFGHAQVTDSTAVLDHVSGSLQAINARLARLEQENQALEDKIEKASKDLKQAGAARPKEGYDAAVGLEVSQAGEVEVELSYLVSGASWSPLYDLRLLAEGPEARLEAAYLAEVAQRTGEAWENVSLALSTAKPQASGQIPELQPWRISQYLPPMPLAAPTPGAGLMRMARAEVAQPEGAAPFAMPAPMMAMEEVVAEVKEAGAALTYQVPRKVSVPSDGSPQKTTIARFELAPKLDYVTAPKLAATVHRRAKVTNSSAYVLLPGVANVFWGDEFVGRATLKNTAPGQEIELSLGLDDRITVERKPSARSAEKVMLRDVRRARWGYEIKVRNLTSQSQRILVRDQIPYSTHEKIVVKLDDASPQPTEATDLGLIAWQLELGSNEEETIRFAFVVEHPRDWRVAGLPD